MSTSAAPLDPPATTYFAGINGRDVDAALAAFAAEASVLDEGRERSGREEIRDWLAETTTKYAPSIAVGEVTRRDGRVVVAGRVSGAFPGSPVDLQFAFTLAGDKIARLEIR